MLDEARLRRMGDGRLLRMAQSKFGLTFVIAVSTVPDDALGQGGRLLSHDLHLVKAALLYADHVTLLSPASSLILNLYTAATESQLSQFALLREALLAMAPRSALAQQNLARVNEWIRLSGKIESSHDVTSAERFAHQLLHEAVLSMATKQSQSVLDMAQGAGADELARIQRAGLLDLYPFDWSNGTHSALQGFTDAIGTAVSDSRRYPLFDDVIARLVHAGLQEGRFVVSDAATARGRHSGVAANVLERLPLFEEATVDEILDIRRELEDPLMRFRRAIGGLSDQIKTAPWNEDFVGDVQDLFMREVEPAVLSIREAIDANRIREHLAGKLVERRKEVAAAAAAAAAGGPSLGMLLSRMHDFSQVISDPSLVAAVGAAAYGGITLLDVFKGQRDESRNIKRNDFFFYYQAGQRLEKRDKKRKRSGKRR